ncbi:DUF1202 family protein [Klebsiella oxytoca]|uniref:DUF1202 family protein n=1 Tax=Klebsiella oxytoca TaxID=571 RepID=UPI0039C9DFCD
MADYIVVDKNWEKKDNINFTATLKSIGNIDSGWRLMFSSVQMSPKPDGFAIPDTETNGKYLLTDSSTFSKKIK